MRPSAGSSTTISAMMKSDESSSSNSNKHYSTRSSSLDSMQSPVQQQKHPDDREHMYESQTRKSVGEFNPSVVPSFRVLVRFN
jgi:hypothetical protein